MFKTYCGVLTYVLGAIAMAGIDASGVCYSPWHHGGVNKDIVQKDLQQVKQYFSGVRTFHAEFSGVNAVDAAASAGLKISVGIMMSDKNKVQSEIEAACAGAIRNPGSVDAIYVGNENLKNGGFGQYEASELVGFIQQVKQKLAGTAAAGVKVGTVQRMTEWKECAAAKQVAAASDVIGVNIYPFFSAGPQTPWQKFEAQWGSLTSMYPSDKLRMTESGWPRAGSAFQGNQPSKENAQKFFDSYVAWSKTQPQSYYFMMYDLKDGAGGPDYEKYFGLADVSGALQITIPAGDNVAPAPAPTNGPAPANTPTYVAPTSTPAQPAGTPTVNTPSVNTPQPQPQSDTTKPQPQGDATEDYGNEDDGEEEDSTADSGEEEEGEYEQKEVPAVSPAPATTPASSSIHQQC